MSSDRVVLRGGAAEAARPVVFGNELPATEIMATGPWADTYNEVKAAAHEEGYREGLAEGLQRGILEGHEEIRRRTSSSLQALDRAVESLNRADAATAGDLAPQMVELALELARLVLHRELAVTEDPGMDALQRVLPLAPERGELAVRMHPEDIRNLGQYHALAPGRDLSIVPDPSLQRGDAVVDVGACRIDGRIEEAFERVARLLRGQELAA